MRVGSLLRWGRRSAAARDGGHRGCAVAGRPLCVCVSLRPPAAATHRPLRLPSTATSTPRPLPPTAAPRHSVPLTWMGYPRVYPPQSTRRVRRAAHGPLCRSCAAAAAATAPPCALSAHATRPLPPALAPAPASCVAAPRVDRLAPAGRRRSLGGPCGRAGCDRCMVHGQTAALQAGSLVRRWRPAAGLAEPGLGPVWVGPEWRRGRGAGCGAGGVGPGWCVEAQESVVGECGCLAAPGGCDRRRSWASGGSGTCAPV